MTQTKPTRICFVCWGNICRSPTAEGIMRRLIDEAGLGDEITIDSAGTSAEHLGEQPDRRTLAEATRRGLDLDHCAWQFRADDFDRFDLVLAADELVASRLRRITRGDADRDMLKLLRSFDPPADGDLDIPDPWYDGPEGFTVVYDIIDAACRGLLAQLQR